MTAAATPAIAHRSITRRLFFIFILFALVPAVTLSLVAIRYISSTAQEQIQRVLDSEVEAFGDMLHGRLNIASRRLRAYADAIDPAAPPPELHWALSAATGEMEAAFARVPWAWVKEPAARRHVDEGRTLLLIRRADDHPGTYLLRTLRESPGSPAIAMRLSEELLLGAAETRNLTLDNCIFAADGELVFGTNGDTCNAFSGTETAHRGSTTTRIGDRDFFMAWRYLFLREQFAIGDWRTGVVTPEADLLRASRGFTSTFAAFALLALLALSLLSVRLIRRQMSPLDVIMSGIARVANRDYAHPVRVDSGDEFEAMADAFNDMSRRVSHQIDTLGSMSEIDQLILSRGKKEDIVRIVLERTRRVLSGDRFALLLPDGERARLYQPSSDDGDGLEATEIALPESAAEAIFAAGIVEHALPQAQLPSFAAHLETGDLALLRIVPVTSDTRLVAVLLVGLAQTQEFDEEERQLAATFADRIAVALANAEWEEKLFMQANYDALTGLPNRPALIDALGKRIANAERERSHFGVLFIDLDNFKLVNDSLGHDSGDQLIGEIAHHLAACLRDDDVVSRLGGDEFIIVSSTAATLVETISTMNGIAGRVLGAISQPLDVNGTEIRATASVGIALYPRDGDSAQELMKNADAAMYHAKAQGPGRYQFFSEELNEQALELMQLSTELKAALERDEFVLHYQPKVNIDTQAIVGAEALIRWQHPTRGLVSPGQFIEAAETLGLINAIGEWTLDTVCRQIAAWRAAGEHTVQISVNIAPSQVQPDSFAQRIEKLLREHGLRGADLELEITERVLMRQVQDTIHTLEDVRDLGVSVSIDDYGTGYSSLSYMKLLPVNKLKIDGSFIVDLTSDPADQAIVSSAILLARRLGMSVVAEGVETAEQAAMLHSFGCDEAQGFYFSRPLPAPDFIQLVDKLKP